MVPAEDHRATESTMSLGQKGLRLKGKSWKDRGWGCSRSHYETAAGPMCTGSGVCQGQGVTGERQGGRLTGQEVTVSFAPECPEPRTKSGIAGRRLHKEVS